MIRQTRTFALAFGGALVLLTIEPAQSQQTTAAGVQVPTVQTPPAQQKGFILGRVVEAGSGRPVAGAIVTLQGTGPTAEAEAMFQAGLIGVDGQASANPQVIADSDGRFVFRQLAPGSYGLAGRAGGFAPGSYGQRRPNGPSRRITLEQDQQVLDATLKMWRYASIAGRLVDESGDAAVGASLNLVRVTLASGRRRLATGGSATTDDRGQYRFGTLLPGSYLVQVRSNVNTLPPSVVEAYQRAVAAGTSGINELPRELMMMGLPTSGVRVGGHLLQFGSGDRAMLPPPPADDGRLSIYPTMFYPAASSSAQAGLVTVSSGEERTGIDMQLKLVRAVTVSGTVTGPDGPANMIALRLLPAGADEFSSDNGLEAATSVSGPDGSFQFFGVPPGPHTLVASRVPRPPAGPSSMTTVINFGGGGGLITSTGGIGPPPPAPTEPVLWARQPVPVGESDVRGVTLSLSQGARIRGRVEFVGAAELPTTERLAQLGVSVSSIDGSFLVGFVNARLNGDGTFVTMTYPPGRYQLNVPPPGPGWYLQSITAGGKDALGAALDLGANDLSGVVVRFTDKQTELSGSARGAPSTTGAPSTDAVVVVFPADVQAWTDAGMSPRRSRTTGTSTTGDFRLPGLPPGEYLVLAVDAEVAIDLQDAQFVAAAARVATRVTLGEGEKKSVSLTVTQIR